MCIYHSISIVRKAGTGPCPERLFLRSYCLAALSAELLRCADLPPSRNRACFCPKPRAPACCAAGPATLRCGTFKIVSIWPVRVPYRNRLYGFMSICYNFWVLIFRCLSVVFHSVSDCNPCAVDARSVLSRWGGCPGALSGRVPKLFGPFCGPTEGCRAFCGGAHAGADDPEGRGPIARLCLPCARMGAMTKKTRRTFV